MQFDTTVEDINGALKAVRIFSEAFVDRASHYNGCDALGADERLLRKVVEIIVEDEDMPASRVLERLRKLLS